MGTNSRVSLPVLICIDLVERKERLIHSVVIRFVRNEKTIGTGTDGSKGKSVCITTG